MTDRVTQALLLLAAARAEKASAEDQEELAAFVASDNENRFALAKAETVWRALEEGARFSRDMSSKRPSQRTFTRRAFIGISGSTLAASLAWGILSPPLHLWPSLFDMLADHRTGPGERKIIDLAEGVTADLNTRTTLNFRNGGKLDLALAQGEVVLSSTGRHVKLEAGPARISLSDGSFAVTLDGGTGAVTGLSGLIDVRTPDVERRIGQGERISFSPSVALHSTDIDIETITAWQRGLLIFKNAKVANIIRELNRYRGGRVFIVNPEVGEKRLTVQVELETIETFIDNLPLLVGARQNLLPGGLVIIS